ncbi:hypothetical protein K9N68_08765 [Kovacikia minuta CCNUW1]|uniref:Ycf66 family protein n=1 Tax=Kovacikia minuta TaxID=2931930 RepID=UPI001CC986E4|nr:Ycf66 family protein [Kovacikia minuta]UBF27969.1 hypothetical protein K9N68_08765 [Kovacikia minuta CCNUW1]
MERHMLAYILALVVGLGSFALYVAAFFFPEVHRKNDFIWSGIGLFYALVLWVCAGRITGGVLLGQTASVALLGWLGWQTFFLRRQTAPADQQTAIPNFEELRETFANLSKPETFTRLTEQAAPLFEKLKTQAQGLATTVTKSQEKPAGVPVDEPYVPLTPADFASARREALLDTAVETEFEETGVEETIPVVEEISLPEDNPPQERLAETAVFENKSKSFEVIAEKAPDLTEAVVETVEAAIPQAETEVKQTVSEVKQGASNDAIANLTGKTGGIFSGITNAWKGLFKPPEPKPTYVRKQFRSSEPIRQPESIKSKIVDPPETLADMGEITLPPHASPAFGAEKVVEVIAEPTDGWLIPTDSVPDEAIPFVDTSEVPTAETIAAPSSEPLSEALFSHEASSPVEPELLFTDLPLAELNSSFVGDDNTPLAEEPETLFEAVPEVSDGGPSAETILFSEASLITEISSVEVSAAESPEGLFAEMTEEIIVDVPLLVPEELFSEQIDETEAIDSNTAGNSVTDSELTDLMEVEDALTELTVPGSEELSPSPESASQTLNFPDEPEIPADFGFEDVPGDSTFEVSSLDTNDLFEQELFEQEPELSLTEAEAEFDSGSNETDSEATSLEIDELFEAEPETPLAEVKFESEGEEIPFEVSSLDTNDLFEQEPELSLTDAELDLGSNETDSEVASLDTTGLFEAEPETSLAEVNLESEVGEATLEATSLEIDELFEAEPETPLA